MWTSVVRSGDSAVLNWRRFTETRLLLLLKCFCREINFLIKTEGVCVIVTLKYEVHSSGRSWIPEAAGPVEKPPAPLSSSSGGPGPERLLQSSGSSPGSCPSGHWLVWLGALEKQGQS